MENLIRFAIIGDTEVGKTTFLKAFANTYRSKKSGSAFRLEFDNRETAEFLSGYYSMQNGKFPDSTLEGSKTKLRWKLFFEGVESPVYLESVDPIGQYLSCKIQGGKKRASEYESQINESDVALIFLDSNALRNIDVNLHDYKELFELCRKRKCKIAILLTKSDLLNEYDLEDAERFLDRYFPELDYREAHVQFVSIGEKDIVGGVKVLNLYKTYGLDLFSQWLSESVFPEIFPTGSFFCSSESEKYRSLENERAELEKKISESQRMKESLKVDIESENDNIDYFKNEIVDYEKLLRDSPLPMDDKTKGGIAGGVGGAIIGGIIFGPIGALIGGAIGGKLGADDGFDASGNRKREQIKRDREYWESELSRLRLDLKSSRSNLKDLQVKAQEVETELSQCRRRLKCIQDEINELLACAESRRSESFKKKIITPREITVFEYDVFNKNFTVQNYWNKSCKFLENSNWGEIIQKASVRHAGGGIISSKKYAGIFKIFERETLGGERRRWFAILLLISQDEDYSVDVVKILNLDFSSLENLSSMPGLKESVESSEALFSSGDLISREKEISNISRKITSPSFFLSRRQAYILLMPDFKKANIFLEDNV